MKVKINILGKTDYSWSIFQTRTNKKVCISPINLVMLTDAHIWWILLPAPAAPLLILKLSVDSTTAVIPAIFQKPPPVASHPRLPTPSAPCYLLGSDKVGASFFQCSILRESSDRNLFCLPLTQLSPISTRAAITGGLTTTRPKQTRASLAPSWRTSWAARALPTPARHGHRAGSQRQTGEAFGPRRGRAQRAGPRHDRRGRPQRGPPRRPGRGGGRRPERCGVDGRQRVKDHDSDHGDRSSRARPVHPGPRLRHPQDSAEQRTAEGPGALQALAAGLGVTRGGGGGTGVDHLCGAVGGITFSTRCDWKRLWRRTKVWQSWGRVTSLNPIHCENFEIILKW